MNGAEQTDTATPAGGKAAEPSPGGLLRRAERRRPVVLIVLLLLSAVVLVRSAWICDDAYITFRVVDNFWSGHGLRWNVHERVCAYTNPLMMLCMLVVYPLTREFFYTGILFCLAASLAAMAVVALGLSRRLATGAVALLLLVGSKAFVDYATSGLENCLAFLLLALFFREAFTRDLRHDRVLKRLAFLAALVTLNRMDTFLLVGPTLVYAWWKKPSLRRVGRIAAGFWPFLIWEVVSVVYYGRPLPNTAYAKLNTGVAMATYLRQGLHYYANSLRIDPITLPTILSAVVAAAVVRRGRHLAAAGGILLYLLYVLRVGGDFMSGRFFAAPLFAAVTLWCVTPVRGRARQVLLAAGAAAVVVTAVLHPLTPVRQGGDYSDELIPSLQDYHVNRGICDERGFYYPTCGLLRWRQYPSMPAHEWTRQGETFRRLVETRKSAGYFLSPTVGMQGTWAGPKVYILDPLGLADPLLAMAPIPVDRPWRIGHMERRVPLDYVQSVVSGDNQMKHPGMARLFDALRRVHRGPVLSPRRWVDIWKLNTGQYDDLIDREYFLHSRGPSVNPNLGKKF